MLDEQCLHYPPMRRKYFQLINFKEMVWKFQQHCSPSLLVGQESEHELAPQPEELLHQLLDLDASGTGRTIVKHFII